MAQDETVHTGQAAHQTAPATAGAAATAPQPVSQPQSKRASKIEQKSTIALFTSLIRQYEFPDHEQLNKLLLKEIDDWRNEDESGMKSSNKIGWHSTRDLFNRTQPGFIELTTRIRAALQNCVQQYVPEFILQKSRTKFEGWVNVNNKGAFNAPHGHAANHFSGVYYVNAPPSDVEWSGMIEFMNPVGAVEPVNELGRIMLPDKFKHRPASGQMLIFPGYVKHWVYPNFEEEERVSIAFNMMVRHLGTKAPDEAGIPGMTKVK